MTTETTVDAPNKVHAPIDPNVKLPPGVLAGLAKAEAAHKAAYNPDPAGQQPAPAPVIAGQSQPQAPAPQAPAPQPAPVAPSVDTLAQYGEPQPQPQPGAGDQPADEGSWEHKFKSQQGRTSAMARTMQDMQRQMMEMGNELIAAQNTIQQMRVAPPQPQPRPSLITDQDRTDFGDDFLSAAARAAQEALLPEVTAARQEAQQTRQELHQMKLGRVYDALTQHIGATWRNVNRHPRFNTWLSLRDPLSGVIRQQLLDGAMQAADAARVVNIFRGFLTEDAAFRPAAPAPQPQPAPGQPAPGQRQPAVNVLDIAAPGRASGAPGSPPAQAKPNYTNRDMDKFYDDVRRGKFAGRDAEKMAIEADLHAAQFDGRFRRV